AASSASPASGSATPGAPLAKAPAEAVCSQSPPPLPRGPRHYDLVRAGIQAPVSSPQPALPGSGGPAPRRFSHAVTPSDSNSHGRV
ncbi:unnamed protein product, partial [Urochloa humidicola]